MKKYRVRYWEKVRCWRWCEDIITTNKEINLKNIKKYYDGLYGADVLEITNVNTDYRWDTEELMEQDFTDAEIEEIKDEDK